MFKELEKIEQKFTALGEREIADLITKANKYLNGDIIDFSDVNKTILKYYHLYKKCYLQTLPQDRILFENKCEAQIESYLQDILFLFKTELYRSRNPDKLLKNLAKAFFIYKLVREKNE